MLKTFNVLLWVIYRTVKKITKNTDDKNIIKSLGLINIYKTTGECMSGMFFNLDHTLGNIRLKTFQKIVIAECILDHNTIKLESMAIYI